MNYIILITTGIIGFIFGKHLAKFHALKKTTGKTPNFLSKTKLKLMSKKSKEALDERTAERKLKILDFLKKELAHQQALANCSIEDRKKGITREDVEKLLDVSDTTAHKYLNELETDQKITQSSPTGRNVHYTLL